MSSQPKREKKAIQKYKTISEIVSELQNPRPIQTRQKPMKPEIDIEAIRNTMKKKWRDPGFCNLQFSKAPIIRAKILNQWEIDRIYQAERSFKYPKNYHGIKFDTMSRQFPKPSLHLHSSKFQAHLTQVKKQYSEKLFGIDPQLVKKGQRIKKMVTQNSLKQKKNYNHHYQNSSTQGLFCFQKRYGSMSLGKKPWKQFTKTKNIEGGLTIG